MKPDSKTSGSEKKSDYVGDFEYREKMSPEALLAERQHDFSHYLDIYYYFLQDLKSHQEFQGVSEQKILKELEDGRKFFLEEYNLIFKAKTYK